jgi:hypothetical protein
VLTNFSNEEIDQPGYHIPSGILLYMPDLHSGLCALSSLTDRKIGDTLSTAQKAHNLSNEKNPRQKRRAKIAEANATGLWSSHALIYGQIEGSEGGESGKPALKLKLAPKVSLAGVFDPSNAPVIVVHVDQKVAAVQPLPGKGTHAIVLLTKSDSSYSISAERADFMPGESHNPICTVWDLSDNRVSDTLKAIQLRRASDKEHQSSKR